MDKITNYQRILSEFLTDYVKDAQLSTMPDVQPRLLIDTERNSFQVVQIGWHNNRFVFTPVFHFDIIEAQLWLQCNNTEWEIDAILIAKGIAKQDFILGFQPPSVRAYLQQSAA